MNSVSAAGNCTKNAVVGSLSLVSSEGNSKSGRDGGGGRSRPMLVRMMGISRIVRIGERQILLSTLSIYTVRSLFIYFYFYLLGSNARDDYQPRTDTKGCAEEKRGACCGSRT